MDHYITQLPARFLAVLLLAFQLSACGGGSGDSSGANNAGTSGSSGTSSTSGTSGVSAQQTGSATLNWTAPVSRTDGNALTMGEIAGYTVYYGTSAGSYTNAVQVPDAITTSTTITGLPLGTYYVVVTASDISGIESGYSNAVTKVVQ